MFKLCDEFSCKPLDIICKTCLEPVKFPSELKKAKFDPIRKKGEKNF